MQSDRMTPANEASETAKDLVERRGSEELHADFLRNWAEDIRLNSGVSVDADRLDAIAVEIERLQAALAARDEEKVVWRDPPEGYDSWPDYLANPPPPTEALKELYRKYRANQALANVTDSQEARRAGMEEAAKIAEGVPAGKPGEWTARFRREVSGGHPHGDWHPVESQYGEARTDAAVAIRAAAQKEGG